MREIRQSGSEGGAGQTNVPFLPLSNAPERAVPVGMCGDKLRQRATMKCKEFWNEVLIFPAKR